VNACALRRGTRVGSALRETEEYRSSEDFRSFLSEQFGPDLEVFEYAKALARQQFDETHRRDATA
jgi:hypothetical protein